jgi:hypothetical protein
MINIALISPRIVYNIALVERVMTITEAPLSNQPPGGHPLLLGTVVTVCCETVKVLDIVLTDKKEHSNDISWVIACLERLSLSNTPITSSSSPSSINM